MIENRDEFHEDEESYLSDKSATEGNSLSISSLSYGHHTFTIVDDELCEANASVYLKEYLDPRILSTTVAPVTCHGNADGEISIDLVRVDCAVEGKICHSS